MLLTHSSNSLEFNSPSLSWSHANTIVFISIGLWNGILRPLSGEVLARQDDTKSNKIQTFILIDIIFITDCCMWTTDYWVNQ